MTLKRIEGMSAFDCFSEEHFKMKCEGYRKISEKQLATYRLVGSPSYRVIVNDAFKHVCLEVHFFGISHSDKKFGKLCRNFLEEYCLRIGKKYFAIKNLEPDNESLFFYTPLPVKQMWEDVKRRATVKFNL